MRVAATSRECGFVRSLPVGRLARAVLAFALACSPVSLLAMDYTGTPDNYAARLARLGAGDRLFLQPGTYRDGLRIHRLEGTSEAPIAILGPVSGPPAVFVAREGANTVSIRDSAHVAIRHLVLDGRNLPVDAVRLDSRSRQAHDIELDDLVIVNHGHDQQIVGISVQAPAWNWIIRHNVIVGAGTGMYLGSSDGRFPFVRGVIEHNLILDTIGYNLQIKHQIRRPDVPGLPTADGTTVIRGNVFVKGDRSSLGRMARPNVLVGHFPASGPGVEDRYLIEGNVFFGNPSETLFQGEGNFALLRNLFVNFDGEGVAVQPHHDVPRRVEVAHNFIAARGAGLHVRGTDLRYPASLHDNEIVDLSDTSRGSNDDGRDRSTPRVGQAVERWLIRSASLDETSRSAISALREAFRLACGDRDGTMAWRQSSAAQSESLCSLVGRS